MIFRCFFLGRLRRRRLLVCLSVCQHTGKDIIQVDFYSFFLMKFFLWKFWIQVSQKVDFEKVKFWHFLFASYNKKKENSFWFDQSRDSPSSTVTAYSSSTLFDSKLSSFRPRKKNFNICEFYLRTLVLTQCPNKFVMQFVSLKEFTRGWINCSLKGPIKVEQVQPWGVCTLALSLSPSLSLSL